MRPALRLSPQLAHAEAARSSARSAPRVFQALPARLQSMRLRTLLFGTLLAATLVAGPVAADGSVVGAADAGPPAAGADAAAAVAANDVNEARLRLHDPFVVTVCQWSLRRSRGKISPARPNALESA